MATDSRGDRPTLPEAADTEATIIITRNQTMTTMISLSICSRGLRGRGAGRKIRIRTRAIIRARGRAGRAGVGVDLLERARVRAVRDGVLLGIRLEERGASDEMNCGAEYMDVASKCLSFRSSSDYFRAND